MRMLNAAPLLLRRRLNGEEGGKAYVVTGEVVDVAFAEHGVVLEL